MSSLERAIEETITGATGVPFAISSSAGLGGGCINDATRVTGMDGRRFFIKRNSHRFLPSFEAEAHSLKVMAEPGCIRVPEPVGTCSAGNQCALVLEYLPMGSPAGNGWELMGQQLARLHRCTSKRFGWDHDNWIGATPQVNSWKDSWITFYAECRLRPQIEWANSKGLHLQEADELINALPSFFDDYSPAPSLLHGDLWSGNASFLEDGSPVIYDPASYYGDRETDLAMSEMFGGFPRRFYEAYDAEWPIDPGYRIRKDLYILYHALNHYNLFGGGYGSQAKAIIRSLLR